MRKLVADKIASVAQHAHLKRELRVGSEIPAEEGVLVAVEVLGSKGTYNHLELTSGRMAVVNRGDIVVGALGHRQALWGYSGHIPPRVAVGDRLHLLNMGGVIGLCDGYDPSLGRPFDVCLLGAVLTFPVLGERIGVTARAGIEPLPGKPELRTLDVPVVAIAGTCMNAGKTAAACAIVSRLRHHGHTVDAFKATGVSLRRDVLAMEDAGARNTLIFTDFGVVSTTAQSGPALTRAMLTRLAARAPDAIVFELGDGLLGAYGVEAILGDAGIRDALSALVLSANDPVAAWGGVRLLQDRFGLTPAVVTGPATDNRVGKEIVERQLAVPAFNAVTEGHELGDLVGARLGLTVAAGDR